MNEGIPDYDNVNTSRPLSLRDLMSTKRARNTCIAETNNNTDFITNYRV